MEWGGAGEGLRGGKVEETHQGYNNFGKVEMVWFGRVVFSENGVDKRHKVGFLTTLGRHTGGGNANRLGEEGDARASRAIGIV